MKTEINEDDIFNICELKRMNKIMSIGDISRKLKITQILVKDVLAKWSKEKKETIYAKKKEVEKDFESGMIKKDICVKHGLSYAYINTLLGVTVAKKEPNPDTSIFCYKSEGLPFINH